MSQQRRVRLSTEKPTSTVYVLGTEISLDVCGSAPAGAYAFQVQKTLGVNYVVRDTNISQVPSRVPRWPLDIGVEVVVAMKQSSRRVNESKVTISYYKANEETPMAKAVLLLTCVEISLDADSSRSGTVTKEVENKKEWTWGPEGSGAILLVNCDRDCLRVKDMDNQDDKVGSEEDLKDMSVMILTTRGPDIFEKYQLVLHVSASENDKVRVFHAQDGKPVSQYPVVLGPKNASYKVKGGRNQEAVFYVEGLAFPDANFSGLVSFHVTLLENPPEGQKFPAPPIFSDTVVFRIAPWIMTPNTLQPRTVYVCSVTDNADFVNNVTELAQSKGYDGLVEDVKKLHRKSKYSDLVSEVCKLVRKTKNRDFVAAVNKLARESKNMDFVEAMKELASRTGCALIICEGEKNQGDRWIQDEMEIGYVQAPHKGFPVVFDSPRNNKLKDFPFKDVLGPDFGYVKRERAGETASALDSFGNLEVSPPVTVRGKQYPLGRILIGSYISREENRQMFKFVRDFLYAQKVQSPVELDSDWLAVGHVDEFLAFVPAPDRKGFRLLLASPSACYKLLKEKEQEGYGDALMFEGKLDTCDQVKIKCILNDQELRSSNEYFQKSIDWNRDILKAELGLTEEDIIDIPQLFKPDPAEETPGKAVAYFPDMVNMLVLERHLGIPKPFGPIVNKECCLEREVRRLLEPLGLSCTFIDDYKAYHQKLGEIHCGTNVCRKPFSFKWWNMTMP
ncbi:protein-arginine deiminase type-3-like [Eublepharis macularius]|uniref:protein-arginine deiminase n=1 Tax=Eublepharis macularius TaxID=481883 RepID=A0AA97KIC0_EUBMA|nr:protein-arginine deiminase type-3-like [Eublepharis macularius]